VSSVPWLAPGLAVSFVVSVAASGPIGRALGVRRALAFALLMAFGIILAATLTPVRLALELGTAGTWSCDLTRIGLPPAGELLAVNDTSLNVLLFVPLGAAIGLLPRSRRKTAIVVAATALPLTIETVQLLVHALDRACEGADVVDNLVGLVLGLAVGSVAGRLARRA